MIKETYLTTDEQLDVLVSLRETLHQVQRVKNDPHCWKWAIIALVSATNGALVCNLTGTMQIGALKKQCRSLMINALQEAIYTNGLSDLPNVYLEVPTELLKMAENRDRSDPGSGPRIKVSQDQKTSFELLLQYRNGFMHFQPMSWSISTPDLPPAFLEVIGIVRSTFLDGHSFRHLTEMDREELAETCAKIEKLLTETD